MNFLLMIFSYIFGKFYTVYIFSYFNKQLRKTRKKARFIKKQIKKYKYTVVLIDDIYIAILIGNIPKNCRLIVDIDVYPSSKTHVEYISTYPKIIIFILNKLIQERLNLVSFSLTSSHRFHFLIKKLFNHKSNLFLSPTYFPTKQNDDLREMLKVVTSVKIYLCDVSFIENKEYLDKILYFFSKTDTLNHLLFYGYPTQHHIKVLNNIIYINNMEERFHMIRIKYINEYYAALLAQANGIILIINPFLENKFYNYHESMALAITTSLPILGLETPETELLVKYTGGIVFQNYTNEELRYCINIFLSKKEPYNLGDVNILSMYQKKQNWRALRFRFEKILDKYGFINENILITYSKNLNVSSRYIIIIDAFSRRNIQTTLLTNTAQPIELKKKYNNIAFKYGY